MALVEKSDHITLKADPRGYPDYVEADVQAIRALNRGDASSEQQLRALEYIVNVVCATYDMTFRPGDPYATHVAEGKRIVGLHLVHLIKNAKTKTKAKGEQR